MMNLVAFFHAYQFTHFADENVRKTDKKNTIDKIKALVFGVSNPRPTSKIVPKTPFEIVYLTSSKKIECWHVKVPNSKGVVAIFHGFSGSKSLMIDKSDAFNALGYDTFLVDFIGSGGSEGNQTTIGHKESQDVKTVFDYLEKQQLKQNNSNNIILFGTSMGAVAILKAAETYNIKPTSAILECPFGTMYKTVYARFDAMNVPCFPMAGLLVFWGGIQNGFWAFSHNPQEYAKSVQFPVLLLYGEKDRDVSREEIDVMFSNFKGKKTLRTYAHAGHENYLINYKNEWLVDISNFIGK